MTLTSPEPPIVRTPRELPEPEDTSMLSSVSPGARRFLAALGARRRVVIGFVLAAAVASAGVAMILPKWYAAQATILPPSDTGESFGLMSALVENSALSKLGLFSSTTPSDIYVEILKSRTLREPLIATYDLQKRYGTKGIESTLKELDTHLHVDVTPNGVVHVRVEDRDPQQAAAMTNDLVAGLDHFNRESVNTRAKRTREFLEGRLAESRARMAQAESTLTSYEQKHKIVASTEASAVGAMADVISQKLSLEVKRSYMASYTRPGSPALRETDAEIAAMDREIGKLPSLKQEGSRLALDTEIQRRVFTLITAQYEDMRVQEARDTPTLTILDLARVPEVRARPRRGIIVAVSTLAALMFSLAWVALTMPRPRRA
jgi:tyrosine-protein kinase Etk/Wzc